MTTKTKRPSSASAAPKKTAPRKRACTRKEPVPRPATGVERAQRYMEGVRSGSVLACEWVRLACARQAKDLARKRFDYHFDVDHANAVVGFIEGLPHIKGSKFAGQLITLSDWQCFIVTTVFGWLNDQGKRRFRTAYIEVPRKNGKSTMSAPVALFCLSADGEPGAEVYSAATTRDQAKIVWGDARMMTQRSADFRAALGVDANARAIFIARNASIFKPLSRDQQGNLDGLNIHCAIVDELHGHKDRGIWDVLETATGAREQPLIWAITTAGSNRAGICYEQRSYTLKILKGLHRDDTYFGIIYSIDEGDDPFDEKSWEKANPNYGVSVDPSDLRRKASKAKQMASALSNFKTKHLNVWVNADSPWMNMTSWEACADKTLDEADFQGENCIIAADLATKTDIAAKIKLFSKLHEDGTLHYYAFGTYFLPEEAVEDGRNSSYRGWEQEGYLTTTPGNATDFGVVENSIRDDCTLFHVEDAVFDPWQSAHMMQNLQADNLPVAEYRQSVQNMSMPMKELEALVLSKRLHHDGNPVLAWMIGNVVCHTDAKDNVYPRKEQPQNKIDGAVALIMALGRALLQKDDSGEFDSFLSSPVA